MAQVGEDCHFFMTAECKNGEACPFRHSQAAKDNTVTTVCQYWLRGSCGRLSCSFRHPSIPKTAPAAPMWPQMMMPPGAGMCKFFLQGTCKNGNACQFSHVLPAFMGGPMQFQNPPQQVQQQQKQQRHHEPKQQQQQPQKKQPKQRRMEETAAEAPPPNETIEEKKARLTAQPLHSDTKFKKGRAEDVVIVKNKKREERESVDKKKPVNGGTEPYVAPQKRNKSEVLAALAPVAAAPAAAPVVKSLKQILAEKAGGGEEATGVTVATGQQTRVGSKASDVDAELEALGIETKHVVGGGGGGGGGGGSSKKVVASKVVSSNFHDDLLALGLDPDDL